MSVKNVQLIKEVIKGKMREFVRGKCRGNPQQSAGIWPESKVDKPTRNPPSHPDCRYFS